MTADIYIISNDTIHALGIKYILKKYFNVSNIVISNDFDFISNKNTSSFYFISTQAYIDNSLFFSTHKNRTIIIGDLTQDNFTSIATNSSESEIVEIISNFFNSNTNPRTNSSVQLSQREIDVLKLVATGHINKEIAAILSISINTVLTHRKNIISKLGIKSASGLGIYAIMNGYISKSDIKNT